MAAQDARMLRLALLLKRFTTQELAAHAKVPPEAANSWVKRQRDRAHITLHEGASLRRLTPTEGAEIEIRGRGRPPKTWVVSETGARWMREELNYYDDSKSTAEAPGNDEHFSRLRDLADRWQEAERFGEMEYQETIVAAARVRVRAAWDGYVERVALGYEVRDESLLELAQLEQILHIGKWWPSAQLPDIAVWIASRFRDMSERGIDARFSARVFHVRAQARGEGEAARLTSAILGLPIWCDELPGTAVENNDVQACMQVLNVVSIPEQLEHAFSVLTPGRPATYAKQPEQLQAVVLGMASAHPTDETVTNWLLSLEERDCWIDALAPAVAFGALDRPHVKMPSVLQSVRPSLERAIAQGILTSGPSPGRIRSRAHQCATTMLLPYNAASTADLMAGQLGKGSLSSLSDYYRQGA